MPWVKCNGCNNEKAWQDPLSKAISCSFCFRSVDYEQSRRSKKGHEVFNQRLQSAVCWSCGTKTCTTNKYRKFVCKLCGTEMPSGAWIDLDVGNLEEAIV